MPVIRAQPGRAQRGGGQEVSKVAGGGPQNPPPHMALQVPASPCEQGIGCRAEESAKAGRGGTPPARARSPLPAKSPCRPQIPRADGTKSLTGPSTAPKRCPQHQGWRPGGGLQQPRHPRSHLGPPPAPKKSWKNPNPFPGWDRQGGMEVPAMLEPVPRQGSAPRPSSPRTSRLCCTQARSRPQKCRLRSNSGLKGIWRS